MEYDQYPWELYRPPHTILTPTQWSSCYLLASLIVDPGVASSILAQFHTFLEIDHEIIFTVILLLPLIQEGLLSITSESMCMKYW